jgi:hypothetical protein
VRPASKAGEGGARRQSRGASREASSEYRAKITHELSRLSRRAQKSGHPAPLGDPTSGVMLVVEQPVGPRILRALERSLQAVGRPDAYVTYASTGLLAQEVFAVEPHALVAVGPGAARDIDAIDHPLARAPFSTAENGAWFAWTKGTAGLNLPALAPALDDQGSKRRFWRAFLALNAVAIEGTDLP